MDKVKPVAWVCDSEFFTDQQMAQVHRHFRMRKGFDGTLVALYDQSAIDALTAEVDRLRAGAERYRWMRTRYREIVLNDDDGRAFWPESILDGPALDKTIDAAMQREAE
jgi:hypothetical protein